MKEFVSAVERAENDEIDGEEAAYVEFKLDGRVYKSHPPTAGQLSMMMASMGRGHNNIERYAVMVDVLIETLDKDDADYLASRMMSRDNVIPMETLDAIIAHLMEEWFGFPTQQSSDSAGSQQSGGPS